MANTEGNWSDYAAAGFADGEGTEGNPYKIRTAQQLTYFSVAINANAESFSGKHIRLENDIDLSAHFWETSVNSFKGVFNGSGYKINGLTINAPETNYCGLFGYINGGTVKNINITGCDITGKHYIGAIAGRIDNGIIESCTTSGTIKSETMSPNIYVGGIAGNCISAKILNCKNNCSVSYTGTDDSASLFGGIAGAISGGSANGSIIQNCINSGRITGKNNVGGIVGQISNQGTVLYCQNYGSVTANQDYAGGITGYALSDSSSFYEIEYCANFKDITARNDSGGIAGSCGSKYNNIAKLTYCINTGKITAQEYAGGITGSAVTILISESFNSGIISAYSSYAGGIAGGLFDITAEYQIINCYNSGSVSANKYSGGILGLNNGKIKNCFNTGCVEGQTNTGAVIGAHYNGGIASHCYYDKNNSCITGAVNGLNDEINKLLPLTTEDMVGFKMQSNRFDYETGETSDYWYFTDGRINDPEDSDYYYLFYPRLRNLVYLPAELDTEFKLIFLNESEKSVLSKSSFKKPRIPILSCYIRRKIKYTDVRPIILYSRDIPDSCLLRCRKVK